MFIETVIAIWGALGIVSLWLLRRAENAYKGCTTPAVHYYGGKRRVHAYACGRRGEFYAHRQPPRRDPQSACKPCRRNMRRGRIAAKWWAGVSIFAGLSLVATMPGLPTTVHPAIVLLVAFLVYPAPLLVAGIAMFVANCGNTLEGGSRN